MNLKTTEKDSTFQTQSQANPLISIIIPVYNQEEFLGRCLDAILWQDFTSFEILVIDDASTDYTPEVCALYAAKDARIKVFTNPQNRGQGYSRNFALSKATAPYVTYVDSDDYIQPLLLHRGIELLESNQDLDIVHFDNMDISITGDTIGWHRVEPGQRTGLEVFQDFCQNKISSYTAWGKVYRKSLLDTHQVYFPECLWEDMLFNLQVYYYAKNILFTGEHGYSRVYTPHAASAMTPLKLTPKHISGLFHVTAGIHDFFTKFPHLQQYEEYFSEHFLARFKSFFAYMAGCSVKNFTPLRTADMQYLSNSPYFLRAILEDYAYIYILRNKYKANSDACVNLPWQDFFKEDTPKEEFLYAIFDGDNFIHPSPLSLEVLAVLSSDLEKLKSFVMRYVSLVKPTWSEDVRTKAYFLQLQQELRTMGEQSYVSRVHTYSFCSTPPHNKHIFSLTKEMLALLPRLLQKKSPKELGENYAKIIELYEGHGLNAVKEKLQTLLLPPHLLANAYTALARHVMAYDLVASVDFAQHAYAIDPKPYRLKWLTFQYYRAAHVCAAAASYDLLPKNMSMHGAEARMAKEIAQTVRCYK